MITLLMATHNGSQFIEEQLDSIREQSVTIDRVIICDDCSSDNTFDIINQYIERFHLKSWMVYRNNCNKGHYVTFLELASQVKEGFVFFCDQDDIWDSNKIEMMFPYLLDVSTSMVFCKSRIIDDTGVLISTPKTRGQANPYSTLELFRVWPSGYQTAFRAEVIVEILRNGYHKCPHFQFHDVLFGMFSCLYGKVIELDVVLDSHRLHYSNTTRKANSTSFHNTLDSRLAYYEKMSRRYSFIQQAAENNQLLEIVDIAKRYSELYQARQFFIKSRRWKAFINMLKGYSYYNGKRAFLSDLIYALRFNHFCYKLMRR